MNTVVHAVGFASVAAEQVVAQIKAVLHDLKFDFIGGVGQRQCLRGCSFGAVFPLDCHQIDQEQHQHHRQDCSEINVKFLANRHRCSSVKRVAADIVRRPA